MKQYNQYLKTAVLIVFCSLVLLFSSCKNNIATETILGNAHLLLVNSAANSSAMNLYWTGNKLNTVPLVYGNTTGYRTLTSGLRDVQIKDNLSNKLLATNTIRIVQDSSYTFFVFEANNATTTVITEDDLSIPSFGNAKIRFANMSPGFSSADLNILSGPIIASSVSFGSVGSYAEVKAGTYNLNLRIHGTSTIVLNLPNVRMDNGKIYTIWSGGTVNGTGSSSLSAQTITQ